MVGCNVHGAHTRCLEHLFRIDTDTRHSKGTGKRFARPLVHIEADGNLVTAGPQEVPNGREGKLAAADHSNIARTTAAK